MAERSKRMLGLAAVLFAVVFAYASSMQGVFVYDDFISIVKNPDVRNMASAVKGSSRPLTNLSFWLHYKLSLTHAAHFHAVNLFLHAVNAVLLWHIFWFITRHIAADRRWFLSSASAIVWAVHPVHAESVTYIVQRAEILSSAFVLGGILFSIQYIRCRKKMWIAGMLVCFVAGYLCKPTAVMAPFLVLAVTSAFAGGVMKNLRENRLIHIIAFCSLIVPFVMLTRTNESSTSAGYSMQVIGFSDYLLFQPKAIVLYLWKLIWPQYLLLDYGFDIIRGYVPYIFAVSIAIIAAFLFRITRRGGVFRLGMMWFFICLAPVVLVPLADLFAEHRVYLASAGISLIFTSAVFELCRLIFRRTQKAPLVFASVILLVTASLAFRARLRNCDYRDGLILWKQVVERRPDNVRGYLGTGSALALRGDLQNAQHFLRLAINTYQGLSSAFLKESFRTDYVYACNNLASILEAGGDAASAAEWRKKAAAMVSRNYE